MNNAQYAILFAAFDDELEKISSSKMPDLSPEREAHDWTGYTKPVARPEHQDEQALERRTKAQGDYRTKPKTRVPRPGKRRGETIEEVWNIEKGKIETGGVPEKGEGKGGGWPSGAKRRASFDGWRKPTGSELLRAWGREKASSAIETLMGHPQLGHLPRPPR